MLIKVPWTRRSSQACRGRGRAGVTCTGGRCYKLLLGPRYRAVTACTCSALWVSLGVKQLTAACAGCVCGRYAGGEGAAEFKKWAEMMQRCHHVKKRGKKREIIYNFQTFMPLKRRTNPSVATINWPFEGMQHLLLDWHLLLAAPVGWGSGLVEGDSEGWGGGRFSGDKPPCPLSLRQQRKWVMFVWKPRAAIPRFDVWATWDAGLHQHSGRGERKGNRTHTDLVLRTNNLSDKPAAIPRKSPDRWGIQTPGKTRSA